MPSIAFAHPRIVNHALRFNQSPCAAFDCRSFLIWQVMLMVGGLPGWISYLALPLFALWMMPLALWPRRSSILTKLRSALIEVEQVQQSHSNHAAITQQSRSNHAAITQQPHTVMLLPG